MLQKVRTAARLILQPSAYPMLWRLTKCRLTGKSESLENSGEEAVKWCQARTSSDTEILAKLFGTPELDTIETLHPAEYAAATAAVANCQQAMGGGAHINLIYTIMRRAKARSAVETGVAYGWSSLAMLLALNANGGGRLASTNLNYRNAADDKSVGCAVSEHLRRDWTLVPLADDDALPKVFELLPEYDVCHYDSDKSYEGRMQTYPLLWEHLKVGGYFISDDIGDNLAFSHFCRQLGASPYISSLRTKCNPKYLGILQKVDAIRYRRIRF